MGVFPQGNSASPVVRSLLLYTKPSSASCRQAGAEPAPGGGRSEAPAVVSHPHTTGGVGGGLGGARSSLATPRPPKPQKVKKPWPKNPLEFVRWMFRIEVRGRYASCMTMHCAMGLRRVRIGARGRFLCFAEDQMTEQAHRSKGTRIHKHQSCNNKHKRQSCNNNQH